MKIEDLFTAESIVAFGQCTADAQGPGQVMFDEYVRDREAQLHDSPCLVRWITLLEEGDLLAAADPALWLALVDQGLVTCPLARTPHSENGVFPFQVISQKFSMSSEWTASQGSVMPSQRCRSACAKQRHPRSSRRAGWLA